MSGARLGVASERISHGWVNGSSSERVGMRHEFGFRFEFRQLLKFSQQPIRSSEFSNSDLYSFGEEESRFQGGAEIARPDNAAPDQTVALEHDWIEHAER